MAAMETTTTVNKIDPELMKYLTPLMANINQLYTSGDLGKVADTQEVRDALAQQSALNQQIMSKGLGTGAMMRSLQNTQGSLLGQRAGALGSARAGRSMDAAMLDKELQLQQADTEARQRAAAGLTTGAEAGRALTQEELDAPYKGISRAAEMFAGVPRSDTSTTTAPKAKSGGK